MKLQKLCWLSLYNCVAPEPLFGIKTNLPDISTCLELLAIENKAIVDIVLGVLLKHDTSVLLEHGALKCVLSRPMDSKLCKFLVFLLENYTPPSEYHRQLALVIAEFWITEIDNLYYLTRNLCKLPIFLDEFTENIDLNVIHLLAPKKSIIQLQARILDILLICFKSKPLRIKYYARELVMHFTRQTCTDLLEKWLLLIQELLKHGIFVEYFTKFGGIVHLQKFLKNNNPETRRIHKILENLGADNQRDFSNFQIKAKISSPPLEVEKRDPIKNNIKIVSLTKPKPRKSDTTESSPRRNKQGKDSTPRVKPRVEKPTVKIVKKALNIPKTPKKQKAATIKADVVHEVPKIDVKELSEYANQIKMDKLSNEVDGFVEKFTSLPMEIDAPLIRNLNEYCEENSKLLTLQHVRSIFFSIGKLLNGSDTIIIEACKIIQKLAISDDKRILAVESRLIPPLVNILDGYHLLLIENALATIASLLSSRECLSEFCSCDPFTGICTVLDSRIVNIRAFSRKIYQTILQHGDELYKYKAKLMLEKNPWKVDLDSQDQNLVKFGL